MTTVATLLTLMPWVAAAIVVLVLAAIGIAIWLILPEASERDRMSDIDRQIATLRKGADHAVARRPRVRANGCAAAPGHIKAAPRPEKPKPCGGGMCRHRADCSDHYCPGRLSASLTGTEARHARH